MYPPHEEARQVKDDGIAPRPALGAAAVGSVRAVVVTPPPPPMIVVGTTTGDNQITH
jgi:hypothetical protein